MANSGRGAAGAEDAEATADGATRPDQEPGAAARDGGRATDVRVAEPGGAGRPASRPRTALGSMSLADGKVVTVDAAALQACR